LITRAKPNFPDRARFSPEMTGSWVRSPAQQGCRRATAWSNEFSKASGNLSIRWERQPCGQAPRSSSGWVSGRLFLGGLLSSCPAPLHQPGTSVL